MQEHRDRERLRVTFGSVAELYDRARPEYPTAVFDDLAELARLEPGSRVLEIEPGTGKATVELARRGYAVTGVELSPELAEIARRNVPEAELVVTDFESWEPREAGFGGVVAFTAFHWIAPELCYSKPARLLELPTEQRDELFRRIHARIAARPSGTVTKHYLLTLTVGARPT